MPNLLKDRIRELRKEHGLIQNAVAESLGLPRGTYVHYELGKRAPDLDMIMRMADLYRVSMDYLSGYSSVRPDEAEWLNDHPEALIDTALPATYRLSRRPKPESVLLQVADDKNRP